jgi:hypothetical protein
MPAADPDDAAECAAQSVYDTADNTPGVAGIHSNRNTNTNRHLDNYANTDTNRHSDTDRDTDTDTNRHANPNGHNHRDANSNGNADYRTRHPGRPWGERKQCEPVPERHPHLG